MSVDRDVRYHDFDEMIWTLTTQRLFTHQPDVLGTTRYSHFQCGAIIQVDVGFAQARNAPNTMKINLAKLLASGHLVRGP